jgi:hypothetical protein
MAREEFILDSSVVIDFILNVSDAKNWFQTVNRAGAAISSITAMEVLRGAKNKRELDSIGRQLSRFHHVHLLRQDSAWAVRQFRHFWLSHQIDSNDCLMAAVAARLQVPLYTLNLKDFEPLPDIQAVRPY